MLLQIGQNHDLTGTMECCGPRKKTRWCTLESSWEGSCSLFSFRHVNIASGASSAGESGSGPPASGFPFSLETVGCSQDRLLGGPLGALPCSSDSFSFSSKRNAVSYHEQAPARAESLLGIPSLEWKWLFISKSVEMNGADDDFPWAKGSINNMSQQHKLPIRCENWGY